MLLSRLTVFVRWLYVQTFHGRRHTSQRRNAKISLTIIKRKSTKEPSAESKTAHRSLLSQGEQLQAVPEGEGERQVEDDHNANGDRQVVVGHMEEVVVDGVTGPSNHATPPSNVDVSDQSMSQNDSKYSSAPSRAEPESGETKLPIDNFGNTDDPAAPHAKTNAATVSSLPRCDSVGAPGSEDRGNVLTPTEGPPSPVPVRKKAPREDEDFLLQFYRSVSARNLMQPDDAAATDEASSPALYTPPRQARKNLEPKSVDGHDTSTNPSRRDRDEDIGATILPARIGPSRNRRRRRRHNNHSSRNRRRSRRHVHRHSHHGPPTSGENTAVPLDDALTTTDIIPPKTSTQPRARSNSARVSPETTPFAMLVSEQSDITMAARQWATSHAKRAGSTEPGIAGSFAAEVAVHAAASSRRRHGHRRVVSLSPETVVPLKIVAGPRASERRKGHKKNLSADMADIVTGEALKAALSLYQKSADVSSDGDSEDGSRNCDTDEDDVEDLSASLSVTTTAHSVAVSY